MKYLWHVGASFHSPIFLVLRFHTFPAIRSPQTAGKICFKCRIVICHCVLTFKKKKKSVLYNSLIQQESHKYTAVGLQGWQKPGTYGILTKHRILISSKQQLCDKTASQYGDELLLKLMLLQFLARQKRSINAIKMAEKPFLSYKSLQSCCNCPWVLLFTQNDLQSTPRSAFTIPSYVPREMGNNLKVYVHPS